MRRTIVGGHVGIEQPNPYALAIAGARALQEAAQVAGHTFIRIKAEHPVELQQRARGLQQQSAVTTFREPARLDVLFPRPVGDDARDFRVSAEDVQRLIRARVVIGDDRVGLLPT